MDFAAIHAAIQSAGAPDTQDFDFKAITALCPFKHIWVYSKKIFAVDPGQHCNETERKKKGEVFLVFTVKTLVNNNSMNFPELVFVWFRRKWHDFVFIERKKRIIYAHSVKHKKFMFFIYLWVVCQLFGL